MNKLKYISLIFCTSSMLLRAVPYIDLKYGVCFPEKTDGLSYGESLLVSGEVGYRFNNWRLGLQLDIVQYVNEECENNGKYWATVFNNRDEDYARCRFTRITTVLNIYHDYKVKENVSLYIGVGSGITKLNYRFCDTQGNNLRGFANKVFDLSKNVWCAQIMAGITYDINAHWALSLGYRCMKMENVYYSHEDFVAGQDIISLKTPYLHSLELGLRICAFECLTV